MVINGFLTQFFCKISIKSFTVNVDDSRFGTSIGVHLDLISVDPVCNNHSADRICLVKTQVSILLNPFFDDQYFDELPPLKGLPTIV